MIVPRHLGLRVWTFPSEATAISTKKGWCPLEMAKFSEGRYEAPQGPVIGGPGYNSKVWQKYYGFSKFEIEIVIFYTEILTGKVVLGCFFTSEMSEKIHNSTFLVKISV